MATKRIGFILVIALLLMGAAQGWPHASGPQLLVQTETVGSGTELDLKLMHQVERALNQADIAPRGMVLDQRGVSVRLADDETLENARKALEGALGGDVVVAPVLALAR